MIRAFLLGLIFIPGLSLKAQDVEAALRRINSLLQVQEAISPFQAFDTTDGSDSIERLNTQIQQGLEQWLNHPSFQPDSHFSLLHHFHLVSSPDRRITSVGFYLNNGGSWQMQYTGLFIRAGSRNRFIPDMETVFQAEQDRAAEVFQPLSGGECLLIAPLDELPEHYLYHTRTVYCGTCLGERIGCFRLDSAGNPVPAYLFEDGSDDLRAEYRHGSECFRFDPTKRRVLLQLYRDDLSEGWFGLAKTHQQLKASWLLREGRFMRESFRYSRKRR